MQKYNTNLVQFAAGIERLRFGYVDRTSEFVLTYEGDESDHSVFPGKRLFTNNNVQQSCVTNVICDTLHLYKKLHVELLAICICPATKPLLNKERH